MRTPLIAGNWKMHGSQASVRALMQAITSQWQPVYDSTEICVLPSLVHLSMVKQLLNASSIHMGAQNLYIGEAGAYTGEVSAVMLKDMGCDYVLIGHSERRGIFKEDLTLVSTKFKAAVEAGLKPILCLGETQEEREAGRTESVIQEQLSHVIEFAGIESFQQAVIAYEPVWAIGTGLTATPQQAQAVHAFIREHIMQNKVDLAKTIRILYGGSMKPDNAAALLSMPDIDGGLIGGASLQAESFLAIVAAAAETKSTANSVT